MPILIAILGAIVAVAFFMIRARNAADMAGDVLDAANDVRLAARRFGFRRRSNLHPVESVDDADVALALTAQSFLSLDGPVTEDALARLTLNLRKTCGLDGSAANEAVILSRWLIGECGDAQAGFDRGAKRLYKLSGAEGMTPLLTVIKASLGADGLSTRQSEALEDLKRVFRVR